MRSEECYIGQRVVVNKVFAGANLSGQYGTVIDVHIADWEVAVEFDQAFPGGHSANGKGKRNHCRFGFFSEISPAEEFEVTFEYSFDDLWKGESYEKI